MILVILALCIPAAVIIAGALILTAHGFAIQDCGVLD